MDDAEYRARDQAIRAQKESELEALLILRNGICGKYRGHFDKGSFWFGFLIGAIAAMYLFLFLADAIHLKLT